MRLQPRPVRFSLAEVQVAAGGRFNCRPAALCVVADLLPEEAVARLPGFADKHYTNPSMMQAALAALGIPFQRVYECLGLGVARNPVYPDFGLVRIQWGGPWMNPGVPVAARYWHTHWIAAHGEWRFDLNAMSDPRANGWIPRELWEQSLVPWLLRESKTKANGEWWPTHC